MSVMHTTVMATYSLIFVQFIGGVFLLSPSTYITVVVIVSWLIGRFVGGLVGDRLVRSRLVRSGFIGRGLIGSGFVWSWFVGSRLVGAVWRVVGRGPIQSVS